MNIIKPVTWQKIELKFWHGTHVSFTKYQLMDGEGRVFAHVGTQKDAHIIVKALNNQG